MRIISTINISKFVSSEKLRYVIKFVNQTANYMWYFSRNCLGLVVRIVMTYFSIFLSPKLCSRQELKQLNQQQYQLTSRQDNIIHITITLFALEPIGTPIFVIRRGIFPEFLYAERSRNKGKILKKLESVFVFSSILWFYRSMLLRQIKRNAIWSITFPVNSVYSTVDF